MWLKTNIFDNYYIKSLNNDEKNIIFYLGTVENANFTGIFKINTSIISNAVNLNEDIVKEILTKFENDNICHYDYNSQTIIFNKNEFLGFREHLNQKTEIKLQNTFDLLNEELKDKICEKFADLKPYYLDQNVTQIMTDIIKKLSQIKRKYKENDTLSTHYLKVIKNETEVLINEILKTQNEFSDTLIYNINNKYNKNINVKKINTKDTLSNKNESNGINENLTLKTKRGRPKKSNVEEFTMITERDGKPHYTKIAAVQVDDAGKELYANKNKKFKSTVKAEDVNYNLVSEKFYEIAKSDNMDKKWYELLEKAISNYYSFRKSQGWVMNRTLEQDITKNFNENLYLQKYRNEKQKTTVIEKIETNFNQNNFNHNHQPTEAQDGHSNSNNFNRNVSDIDNNGNNDKPYQQQENKGIARDFGPEQPIEQETNQRAGRGQISENGANKTKEFERRKEGQTEKEKEHRAGCEYYIRQFEGRPNTDYIVQLILKGIEKKYSDIYKYMPENGYFIIT